MSARERGTRPGPRRNPGEPSGPQEVRRAVLDAAADLFARDGVAQVSLRDIAQQANVQVALITRYFGTRDLLVTAVFEDVTTQLAEQLADFPTSPVSFERNSVPGAWTMMLTHFCLVGDQESMSHAVINPVLTLAGTIHRIHGFPEQECRVRAAHMVASALGWRLFEGYVVPAGELQDVPVAQLRNDFHYLMHSMAAAPVVVPLGTAPLPSTAHEQPLDPEDSVDIPVTAG